jgi:hypothetical protein
MIDTHAHADHLTAMPFFKKRYGARTVTGSRMGIVQRAFRDIYNLGADFPVDGRQFDLLLDEGQELAIGSFLVRGKRIGGISPGMNLERGAHTRIVVAVKPPKHPDLRFTLHTRESGFIFFVQNDSRFGFCLAYPADWIK